MESLSINEILCSLNSSHILKNPVTLSCKNSVCLSCLNKISSYNGKIKCILCGNQHDLKNDKINYTNSVNLSLENAIEQKTLKLCEYFYNLQHKNIDRCIDRMNNFEEYFENYIEYINGDLDIRTESIKMELDNLKNKMYKKLDSFKEKFLIKNNSLREAVDAVSCLSANNSLNSIEVVEVHAMKLLGLSKQLQKSMNNLAIYKINDYFLQKCEFFGLLRGPILYPEKLSQNEPIIINLSQQVQSLCSLCVIKDNYIAVSDFKSNQVYVFDRNFVGFERFSYVQGIKIRNYYGICASDDYESIYFCDLDYSRILIVNNDFNLIKKIILKPDCAGIVEFDCPRDIYFHSNRVFVLDQGYKSVFIFNKYGDYLNYFSLENENHQSNDINVECNSLQNPLCIAANEKFIAIVDWKKSIFIYDFDGKLKKIIEKPDVTSMCVKYEYLFTHGEDGTVACYKNDTFDFEFSIVYNVKFDELKYRSESIAIFNEKLVISMGWAKFLAILFVY